MKPYHFLGLVSLLLIIVAGEFTGKHSPAWTGLASAIGCGGFIIALAMRHRDYYPNDKNGN